MRLYNEELCDLLCVLYIWVVKAVRLRWVGYVVYMKVSRGAYSILVRKPEGRRPLGSPRHGWEDNIKIGL
jgi:hypothetical protein